MHRGTGLAHLLVDQLRREVGKGTSVELAVVETNTRARRFYTGIGFQSVGTELGERSGDRLVRMAIDRSLLATTPGLDDREGTRTRRSEP
jgi:ribosomal protein S18 acetylase RimI-like enzyme